MFHEFTYNKVVFLVFQDFKYSYYIWVTDLLKYVNFILEEFFIDHTLFNHFFGNHFHRKKDPCCDVLALSYSSKLPLAEL